MQQRISEWTKKFNIVVVPCEERPDNPAGKVVYRLKDLFTTCEGQWDPSGEMGSLPQWARETYLRPWGADDYFDDAGGAQNLFARVLDLEGSPVKIKDLVIGWSDGFHLLGQSNFEDYVTLTMTPKEKSGWGNQPIWNKFYPDSGQRGAWCWCPRGASDVVWGGGLPYGHHISTFAVWQAELRGDDGDDYDGVFDLDAVRRLLWTQMNITYHHDSAFARYSRIHNLGAPLTNEIEVGSHRVQGFANAIVYAPIGAENQIAHIAW